MKLGVIARADDRGLGNQTWEVARNMNPERVLVVRVPGSERQGFGVHLDRFPNATEVTVDESDWSLPQPIIREWLDGLDVVYTAETVYDQRLIGWANEQHVATVVHSNPEFLFADHPAPTVRWLPTDWRLDDIPGAVVVPMPVALDRFPHPDFSTDPLRAVHIIGRRATADRNGLNTVIAAQRFLDIPIDCIEQTDRPYWENYQEASVLVLPRRYGGLCLPANEACAAGLVPIMPDCSPNRWWPIEPVDCWHDGNVHTPGGELPLFRCHPEALADAIRAVFANVAARRMKARQWARQHSWEALRPLWTERLEQASSSLGDRTRTASAYGTG